MRILNRLLLAASCVTAFPVGRRDVDLSGLSKYLPSVGLFIGIVLAATGWLCDNLAADHLVKGALLVVLWLAMSGGIHFDGLMDTADGIFSHRSRQRMLEIMQDSRVGNFGVLTGVAVLLIKFACLAAANVEQIFLIALIIPAWARWTETLTIATFPYARQSGMGKIWHETTNGSGDVLIAAVVPLAATAAAVFFWGFHAGLLITAATILCGYTAALRFWTVLGGQTGDTYGAVVELAEAGGLLLAALLIRL